jgi:hypothetical protein
MPAHVNADEIRCRCAAAQMLPFDDGSGLHVREGALRNGAQGYGPGH